jgi:hypothetical protein
MALKELKPGANAKGQIIQNEDGTYHLEVITDLPEEIKKGAKMLYIIYLVIFVVILAIAGYFGLLQWFFRNMFAGWIRFIIMGVPTAAVIWFVCKISIEPLVSGLYDNELFIDQIILRAKKLASGNYKLDSHSIEVLKHDMDEILSQWSYYLRLAAEDKDIEMKKHYEAKARNFQIKANDARDIIEALVQQHDPNYLKEV